MLTNELINITLQQRQYEYEQALAVQQEKTHPATACLRSKS